MNYGIPDWDYDDRRHAIIPRANFGDDEFFETEDALKLHQKEVSEMLIRILLGFANYMGLAHEFSSEAHKETWPKPATDRVHLFFE